MAVITRILYPTDLSEHAAAALAPAATLARTFRPAVFLLHATEPLPLLADSYCPPATWEAYAEEPRAEAMARLDLLARQLKAEGVTVTTRLATGPVVSSILKVAEEVGVNMIARGTQGRTRT